MKRLLLAFVVFAFVVVPVFAVGTVTVTNGRLGVGHYKYTVAWVADGSGDVSANSFTVPSGYIHQAYFEPSATAAPDALYDATFTYNGVDIIQGSAANLSATTNTMILFSPAVYYDGKSTLDLVISNAGATREGTFVFWLQPNPR